MRKSEFIKTLEQDGYVEISAEARLKNIVSNRKKFNFHQIVNPNTHHNTSNTPITREDYASISMMLFLEDVQHTAWEIGLDEQRFVFYEFIGKAYYKVSNTELSHWLNLYAKKVGVPDRFTSIVSFCKALVSQLRHSMKMDEMDKKLNR